MCVRVMIFAVIDFGQFWDKEELSPEAIDELNAMEAIHENGALETEVIPAFLDAGDEEEEEEEAEEPSSSSSSSSVGNEVGNSPSFTLGQRARALWFDVGGVDGQEAEAGEEEEEAEAAEEEEENERLNEDDLYGSRIFDEEDL